MALLDSILFVDDDPVANFHHRSLAKELNVAREVIVRTNGKEAMNFIKELYRTGQSLPSLIVADLNLPVMNGMEFIRELRTSDLLGVKRIPVAIVAAASSPRDLAAASEYGCSLFCKPLCHSLMAQIVNAASSGMYGFHPQAGV